MSLVDEFADFIGSVPYRETELPWGRAQVWDAGEGPPVVLLHGVAGARRLFFRLVPELAGRHRVLVPPLRGEDIPALDSDPEPYLDDLAALLDAAGVEKVTLFGTSFGAYLALGYAARNDPRVARVVLQGGFPRFRLRPMDRVTLRLSYLLPASFGSAYFKRRVLKGRESRLLRQHAPELETLVADWMGKTPFVSLRARTRMIAKHDMSGRAHRIAVPITLAQGAQDAVVPRVYFSELCELRPDAEVVVWDDAAHLVPITHPERLAQLVRGEPHT